MMLRKFPLRAPRPLLTVAMPVALSLAASPVRCADWLLVPNVGVRETYSDNINLATDGARRSDWVTSVIPGIAAAGNGPRFSFRGNYAAHVLNYRNTGGTDVLNVGDAAGTAELVKDWLFVDGAASLTQQNISGFGAQSVDIVNNTGNRSEVRNFGLSPYLRHNFGDFARSELRYSAQSTRASQGSLVNANAQRVTLDVASGPRLDSFGWEFLADRQRVDYTDAFAVDFNRYVGKLRYSVTPRLAVHVIAGHEGNDFPAVGGDRNGHVWAGAATWTPTPNTVVAASAGRRFFGQTYNLLVSRRTARSAFVLGYSEDVTTLAGIGSTGNFEAARVLTSLALANSPLLREQAAARPPGSSGVFYPADMPGVLPGLPLEQPRPESNPGDVQDVGPDGKPLPARRTPPASTGPAGQDMTALAQDGQDTSASREAGVTPPQRDAQTQGQAQQEVRPQAQPRQQPRRPAVPTVPRPENQVPEVEATGSAPVNSTASALPAAPAAPDFRLQSSAAPSPLSNPLSVFNPQAAGALSTAEINLLDPFALNSGVAGTLTGLASGISNRVYLQKLAQASFEVIGARNNFLTRVFHLRREPLSAAFTAGSSTTLADDNSRQIGINALFTHNLTQRTSFTAGAAVAKLDSYISQRTDRDASVSAGITHRLREKAVASIQYRHQLRHSSEAGSNYRENAVVVLLHFQL